MESPKIGERVKFWQEQDRINRELIPRVIKSHELLTKHVETHDEGYLAAMSRIQSVESQVGELATETKGQIEAVEGQVTELSATTTENIQSLETRTSKLERRSTDLVSRLVPYAALAVAVVALVIALVK